MRLIFKARTPDYELLLHMAEYRALWQEYGSRIRRAFTTVTGLRFQQYSITVHVVRDDISRAGTFRTPMTLSINRNRSEKLLTLIHELSHRLLGGNWLGAEWLYDFTHDELWGDTYIEAEHCNTYLFQCDVVRAALGSSWLRRCFDWENRPPTAKCIHEPHVIAWSWAMSLSRVERQQRVEALATRRIERKDWHKYDDDVRLLPAFQENTNTALA